MADLQPAAADAPAPRRPWWKAPYLHLALSILLNAAAQLLDKHGVDQTVTPGAIFGFAGLRSWWVWGGQTCMVLSLVSWLIALRSIPLSTAFNFTGATHIIIPLAAWLFLGEHMHAQRWVGIALIFGGIIITARQAGAVEERL